MKNEKLTTKLRELRKAHGYKQVEVASALGISRQAYSNYETGDRTPDSSTLYKLAGFYNISVEDLLQLTIKIDRDVYYDAPAPTQSGEELAEFVKFYSNPQNERKYASFTNTEKKLLFFFNKVSEADQEDIIEFLKIKARRYKK